MKKTLTFFALILISAMIFGQATKIPMNVHTKLYVAFPIVNKAIDTLNKQGDTLRSIQTQLNNIKTGIFNVKDYGVIGNGIIDDASTIQSLIASNKTLFFPSGTYKIGSYLTISEISNFKMIGEKGTIFKTIAATGSGKYYTILLGGNISDIEISNIKFSNTTIYANELYGQAFIYSAGLSLIANRININNCIFTAPNLSLDGTFFGLTDAESLTDFRFENNTIDSVGCNGIELYQTSYANRFDSTSFQNIRIKNNNFSYFGMKGFWGLAISMGGNDVNISGNIISHNKWQNEAIEIGHSYRVICNDNIITGSETENQGYALYVYRSYELNFNNNDIYMPGNITGEAYAIGMKESNYLTITGNTMNLGDGFSIDSCKNGTFNGNILISTGPQGLWLSNVTANFIISGNRIMNTKNSGVYGAVYIDIAGGSPIGNVIINNIVTSVEANKEYRNDSNAGLNMMIPAGKILKISGALTDGIPTDAEIDMAIGLTPATAGAGYQIMIMDNNGTGLIYLILSDGTYWYYTITTKAI